MNPIYLVGWFLSRFFALILLRVKVRGREHLPKRGGFILACNHISYYDPPLVGSCVYRPMNFLAKKELFKNKFFAWVLKHCHALPVRRGTIDRKAIEICQNALGQGEGLIMFPEGTRSKTPQLLPPKPGIGMIALGAGVPIVPAFVEGSNRIKECLLFKRRLRVSFGEPIEVDWINGLPVEKESYLAVASEIMDRIVKLRAEL